MYNRFFGFREKPFKLIPNPDFLYLGESHKNALAHLTYAVSQGDGFVEITGEVGTGKTTLCRVFLENLGPDTEAAYIFNSKLDSVQLLRLIHKELGIRISSEDPVDLIQNLNRYLLEKKSSGKSVLLLIDEAQHLGSDTLEQLRLLSNLETSKNKLLQIILVGQPELGAILDSFDMRQLRQRISLSCRIAPLSAGETREYIDHRLKIAARKPTPLFSNAAKKLVHKFSNGVPRRINIICDRALIVAYGQGLKNVDTRTVKAALKELRRPRYETDRKSGRSRTTVFSIGFIVLAAVFFLLLIQFDLVRFNNPLAEPQADDLKNNTEQLQPLPQPEPNRQIIISKTIEPILTEDTVEPQPEIKKEAESFSTELDSGTGRESVFNRVLHLWGRPPSTGFERLSAQMGTDHDFFRLAGMQNNIIILHVKNGFDQIEKYNFPAILKLASRQTALKPYVVIENINSNNECIIFTGSKSRPVRISRKELLSLITEDAFITCENIFGYSGVIADSSPKFSVLSVKLLLRRIGFSQIDMSPVYNPDVKNAVKQIQEKHGLEADGLVGPRTKLAFIQEKNEPSTPFLRTIPPSADKGIIQ